MRYFRIYKLLLALNFQALLIYRGNFYTSLFSSVLFGLLSILTIVLLTSQTSQIYGWTRNEIILVTTVYGVVIGTFHMLFSRNFERFSRVIHLGQLDTILTKPVDSQFLVSFWMFNYTSIARILLGLGFTAYMISVMRLTIGFVDVMSFFLFTVFGVTILYSIWFCITTITIWFTRLSNLVDLLYYTTGFARFPQEMYRQFAYYVFLFLLPLTFIVVMPTKAVLQKIQWDEVVTMVVIMIVLLTLSRTFWKFALRYYTSASS